ncbi:MAG: OmpA family protein [Saprospiraceae bacterium]|nr:OmpA family protein [Saprospiraceae bacterium]
MKKTLFICYLTLTATSAAWAQSFRVQIAAYSEKQDPAYFEERGVTNYSETEDASGIFWYAAGEFQTREDAENSKTEMIAKGFPYAIVIDLEEQRLLSGVHCPYIRNGVVIIQNPKPDPSKHVIYFGFGSSGLDASSRAVLDEIAHKMKQNLQFILKIAGFTDGVGDARANLELAATRSREARNYLIYKGIRADRMIMEVFGEADPAAPNAEDDGSNEGKGRDLPENRKWNRRVTLSLETPAGK